MKMLWTKKRENPQIWKKKKIDICLCVYICTRTHKHFIYFFVRFSFLECKESLGYVSQWIIRLTKCFLEETKRRKCNHDLLLAFLRKKIIFTSGFPVKNKKQTETKTPSSWGHELTFVPFYMLLIPTWFLLFDGFSLLNLGKINSVRLFQASRAGGKEVPHQKSHGSCSITTLGQSEEFPSSELLQAAPHKPPLI